VAQAPSYPTLFAALVLAGLGLSGFTAAQGSLVMAAAPPTMRSQAMGLLATAVGVLPLGTLVLGLVAEHLGPVAAVTGSGLLGITFLALWTPMWLAVLRLPPTIPIPTRAAGGDDEA
jgi:MFS family permease